MSSGHLSEEALVWHYYGEDADTGAARRPRRRAPAGLRQLPGRAGAAEGDLSRSTPGRCRTGTRGTASRCGGSCRGRRRSGRRRLVGDLAALESLALAGAGPCWRGPSGCCWWGPSSRAARSRRRWRRRALARPWCARADPGGGAERPPGPVRTDPAGDPQPRAKRRVDIGGEQQRAAGPAGRQPPVPADGRAAGTVALASVLEDLERVLLDVARGPARPVRGRQLADFRARIDEQGLVFKVRVLEPRLREMGSRPAGPEAAAGDIDDGCGAPVTDGRD